MQNDNVRLADVHRVFPSGVPYMAPRRDGERHGIVHWLFATRADADFWVSQHAESMRREFVVQQRPWHPSIIADGVKDGTVIDKRVA